VDIKYLNTRTIIQNKSSAFEKVLRSIVGIFVWKILEWLCTQTNVYVFSGVIRNFLLGKTDCRDLDIVVDSLDSVRRLLNVLPYAHKNQFGGFKISFSFLDVDVWELDKTWGIKAKNMNTSPTSLVNSAFFNFSGILYHLNEHRFLISEQFCYFYNTKEMDLILEENPFPELCIVNTFYYQDKYSFKISNNLKKWIVREYAHIKDKQRLINVQVRHYSRIYYSLAEIQKKILGICCQYKF